MRDKPYKVFVSHSIAELELATTVCNCLNSAFGKDKVNFTYSSEGQYGGINWREKIREQLSTCEAGLFLLTPQYIESPWSIAEYAAFWIQQDKKTYLFTLGNADYKKIFGVVDKNIQIEDITNKDKTKNFFTEINSIVNTDGTPAPHDKLDDFISKCKEAYGKCEQKRTGRETARYSYLNDHTKIEYSINDDRKTLMATITKTLGLRCLSENLPYINVFKEPLATLRQCTPCDEDSACVITANVTKADRDTVLRVNKPQKCQFRVSFNPVLRKDQEIEIEVKVVIPAYRVATFEECLNNMKSSRTTLAEQANVYTISEQTNSFSYEIVFPVNYPIQDKPPLAKSRKETNAPFKEDEAETKIMQNESGWERIDSQWRIKFKRENPQIGMSYHFTWLPPNETDLL